MSAQEAHVGRRVGRDAAASVVAWAAAVGLAYAYLRGAQPAPLRALPLTHADSIGLPLVAWALAVAGVLVVANLGAAVIRGRRRRGAAAPSRRPNDR